MPSQPLRSSRILPALIKLGLRRLVAQMGVAFSRRKSDSAQRGPTRPKQSLSLWLVALLGAAGLLTGLAMGYGLLNRLQTQATRHVVEDRLGPVDSSFADTHSKLRRIQRQLSSARDQSRYMELERQRQALRQQHPRAAEDYDRRRDAREGPNTDRVWPTLPEAQAVMVRTVALLLGVMVLLGLLLSLSATNRDLSQPEWSMQWLFSLPIGSGWIFAAHWLQYSLINPVLWLVVAPMLCVWYFKAGLVFWGIGLGIIATAYLGLLIGAGRLAIEVLLRTRLRPPRIKNLQASFTIVGMLGALVVLGGVYQDWICTWWIRAAGALPIALLAQPLSLPAWAGVGSLARAGLCVAGMALSAAAAGGGAIAICRRATRNGLIREGGSAFARGRRKKAPGPGRKLPRLRGIAGKDLRLLLRDRNFLVQTVFLPIFIVAWQFIVNPNLYRAAAGSFRHAAALAFGVGAYVLAICGTQVLTSERKALWLLYALPRRLDRLMLRKAMLWGAIALAYPICVLAVAMTLHGGADGQSLLQSGLALVGVGIFALVASGLGILGANPLAEHKSRQVRQSAVWLYMALASMYVPALYAPNLWSRLQIVLLAALVAVAIWEKVARRLPFLLDPTARPAGRLTAADGIIAVYAFQALQLAILLGLLLLGAGPLLLTAGFAAAGALVVPASLGILRRRGVPDLLAQLGLRPGRWSGPPGRCLAIGVGAGMASAAVGGAYLYLLANRFPTTLETMPPSSEIFAPGWWALLVLAVVPAPVIEEYLFRGLLAGGLRRLIGPGWAIIAATSIFALLHPPVSIFPVWCMGLAAGIVMLRTRCLPGAIACHAVYNLAMVALSGLVGSF